MNAFKNFCDGLFAFAVSIALGTLAGWVIWFLWRGGAQ
jgi:hypothetical protein